MGIVTGIFIILILCFIFSHEVAMILFVSAGILVLIGVLVSLIYRDIGSGAGFVVLAVVVGIIGLIIYFDHDPIITKKYSFNDLSTKTIHVKLVDGNWTPYIYFEGDVYEKALGELPGEKMEDEDSDGWYDKQIITKDEMYFWIITDGTIEHQSRQIDQYDGGNEIWVEISSDFYNGDYDTAKVYSFNPEE